MGEKHDDDEVTHLAETFAEVARALARPRTIEGVLDAIVRLAVETLDACEHAGISRIQGASITSPASTGDVPHTLDAIQEEVDEGPCLDAIRGHEVLITGDLAREERWPAFAARAHRTTGVRSILSARLYVDEDTMGSLNLYSSEPRAFHEVDVALATVFASHAALALSAGRRERDLERKAQSRDVIGRAKGVLMAREGLSDEQAFDVLRRASQRLNIKLTKVAEDIAGDPGAAHGQDQAWG